MSNTIVPGYGPSSARIVIVGEAPGEQEVSQGRPFVGPSGQVLSQMLSRVGIDRSQCYLTNVCKVRPPANDFGAFYEDPQPARRFKPLPFLVESTRQLHKEIASIHPNVIIACGGEALRAITNLRGIDKWRGSILSSPVGKVVPTFHPARVMRVWEERPIAEADLKRAWNESTTRDITLPPERFELFPPFGRVMEFLRVDCHRAPRVAVDIETVSPGWGVTTRCIGIADTDSHAMCIPLISSPRITVPGGNFLNFEAPSHANELNSYYGEEEEYEILSELDRVFRKDSIRKVLQNFPFDATILAREYGFDIRSLHMDTLMAQHTCYAELPKGLDFLCSIYTRRPYYSDFDNSVDDQVFRYNCLDCCVTLEVSNRLDSELESMGLTEFYHNHVQPTLLAITRAQNRGVVINVEKRSLHARRVEEALTQTKLKLSTLVGFDINPNSPPQMQKLLYTTLGVPPRFHHQTKKITTDEDAIERIMLSHPQHAPLLSEILNYRKTTKLLGNFLTNPLREVVDSLTGETTSRLFTTYNCGGTVTGRLTSSKNKVTGEGAPLQTFPRGTDPLALDFGLREIFTAPRGWVLSKGDLSQAEFRYVVWKARIFRLIEKYTLDPDFDVHCWNASVNVFFKPASEVSKDERSKCKNGIYGGQYGMHFRRAAVVYEMSLDDAKMILDRLHKGIPEISQQYWPMIQRILHSRRLVENELGRKRFFFGRMEDDTFRAAYSGTPQSVVADLINRSFHLMDEIFPESEAYPLMQVHDEIVGQYREEAAPKYVELARKLMEYPISILSDDILPPVHTPLVIPAEIGLGPDWFHQKEVKL